MNQPCPVCHRTASQAKGRPCPQCRDEQLERNRHTRRTVASGLVNGHVDQKLEYSKDTLRRIDRQARGE